MSTLIAICDKEPFIFTSRIPTILIKKLLRWAISAAQAGRKLGEEWHLSWSFLDGTNASIPAVIQAVYIFLAIYMQLLTEYHFSAQRGQQPEPLAKLFHGEFSH